MSELVRKEELASALEARRELGPDYEDELVGAFVEKIEQRLAERAPAPRRGAITPVVLGSLGVSIPLIAIAGGTAGWAGVVAVCLAVVLVNYFAAKR